MSADQRLPTASGSNRGEAEVACAKKRSGKMWRLAALLEVEEESCSSATTSFSVSLSGLGLGGV